ncbi:MAG TPA: hypothetical protein VEV15_13280 [Flavisolibacter sp.]|nr:hypothetical protein [Flavisolibacter sp.]
MKTLISYVALTVFILASSFTIDVQQNLNRKSTQATEDATDCKGSASYKDSDNSACPGHICYRVIALKKDGSRESSPSDKIHMVQKK